MDMRFEGPPTEFAYKVCRSITHNYKAIEPVGGLNSMSEKRRMRQKVRRFITTKNLTQDGERNIVEVIHRRMP